jgi:urea transport system substrate-binding protein
VTDLYRVGLVVPLQGPAGIFAPSCEAVTELAVRTVNAAGGISGREVVVEVIDGGGDPAQVAHQVDLAIRAGRVQAITGWHISAVRRRIAPVTSGRVPYIYTSLYEGGERTPGVICSGEVPAQQIRPALRWLRDQLGVRNWCIVGDDYIWPRGSAAAAQRFCRELGLTIRDQVFVRYGTRGFAGVIRRVRSSGAQGVLMLLVGQDAVMFNRAFAAAGLHEQVVRFSPLMEENMLLASGAHAVTDLYVAASYFRSLATADALHLTSEYTAAFGPDAPPLNAMAESCHGGIMMLRAMYDRAGCGDLPALMSAAAEAGLDGPRGPRRMSGGICLQRVYLARADGFDFDVIQVLRDPLISRG